MKLYAGAGRAEIEFRKEMLPTEGFDRIHDLPHVGLIALAAEDGDGIIKKAVLISMDIVMLTDELMLECRKTAADICGTLTEDVWGHTTHAISTPHRPGPMGPPGMKKEPTEREKEQMAMYDRAVLGAVKKAAEDAAKSMRPAKMGTGSAQCLLNVNRDVETPQGWWINLGSGPSDHTLTAVKFEDEDGKNIGAILHYDMKPCTIDNSEMDKGTRAICADATGLACSLLSEKYGPVLYFMGTAGDQVPKDMALLEEVQPDGTVLRNDRGVGYGLKLVDEFGKILADDAGKILSGINCDRSDASLKTAYGGFEYGCKGRAQMKPCRSIDWKEERTAEVDTEIMTLGDVALIGFKPEICYETGRQLKERSPYRVTLPVSMINGGQKYMPDASAYERCTWEAQSAMFMPGAAEKMTETAAAMLADLSDRS